MRDRSRDQYLNNMTCFLFGIKEIAMSDGKIAQKGMAGIKMSLIYDILSAKYTYCLPLFPALGRDCLK